ncbi:MAG: LOG family protein [Actinomycetota bacterium]
MRLPRFRTGDPQLDAEIAALVEQVGGTVHDDLIFEIIASALLLARDGVDRGDLKMANATLQELRQAFATFAPYRATRKVGIFGSARTERDDPLYQQTVRLAQAMAARDWMVITGAGPGIMEAGIEGAGARNAFGVAIRLPFESPTSQLVSDDPKLMRFRYFFTRKVTFLKESDGFVLVPGGFGTMDEAFELLTLVQTGKAPPAPIVLLDVPGGTYWSTWHDFVRREVLDRGYVSAHDLCFVRVTDDVEAAVDELVGFFANYQSLRMVAGRLVLRMRNAPDGAELDALNRDFADIVVRGRIERIDPTPAEEADQDGLDLERLLVPFDRRSYARLRELIDRINGRPSHR